MDERWQDDPLEGTDSFVGSGNFLADRGYSDPEEVRIKFHSPTGSPLLIEDHGLRQADVWRMTGLKPPMFPTS